MRTSHFAMVQQAGVISFLTFAKKGTLEDISYYTLLLLDKQTQTHKLKNFRAYKDTISARMTSLVKSGIVVREDRGLYRLGESR